MRPIYTKTTSSEPSVNSGSMGRRSVDDYDEIEEENEVTEQKPPLDIVKVDLFNLINKFESDPYATRRRNFLANKSKSFSSADKRPPKIQKKAQDDMYELDHRDDNNTQSFQVKNLKYKFENNKSSLVSENKISNDKNMDGDLEKRIADLERNIRLKTSEYNNLKRNWNKEIEELLEIINNNEESARYSKRLLDLKGHVKSDQKMSTNVKNLSSGDFPQKERENGDDPELHFELKVSEIKRRYEKDSNVPVTYPVFHKEPIKAPKYQQPIETSKHVVPEEIEIIKPAENDEPEDFHIPNNFVKQLSQVYEQNATKSNESKEEKSPTKVTLPPQENSLQSARVITSYFNTLSNIHKTEEEPEEQDKLNHEIEEEIPVEKDYVRKLSNVFEQNLKREKSHEEENEETLNNEENVEEIPVQKNFVRNLSHTYEETIINPKEEEEQPKEAKERDSFVRVADVDVTQEPNTLEVEYENSNNLVNQENYDNEPSEITIVEEIPVEKDYVKNLTQDYEENIINQQEEQEIEERTEEDRNPEPEELEVKYEYNNNNLEDYSVTEDTVTGSNESVKQIKEEEIVNEESIETTLEEVPVEKDYVGNLTEEYEENIIKPQDEEVVTENQELRQEKNDFEPKELEVKYENSYNNSDYSISGDTTTESNESFKENMKEEGNEVVKEEENFKETKEDNEEERGEEEIKSEVNLDSGNFKTTEEVNTETRELKERKEY